MKQRKQSPETVATAQGAQQERLRRHSITERHSLALSHGPLTFVFEFCPDFIRVHHDGVHARPEDHDRVSRWLLPLMARFADDPRPIHFVDASCTAVVTGGDGWAVADFRPHGEEGLQ